MQKPDGPAGLPGEMRSTILQLFTIAPGLKPDLSLASHLSRPGLSWPCYLWLFKATQLADRHGLLTLRHYLEVLALIYPQTRHHKEKRHENHHQEGIRSSDPVPVLVVCFRREHRLCSIRLGHCARHDPRFGRGSDARRDRQLEEH